MSHTGGGGISAVGLFRTGKFRSAFSSHAVLNLLWGISHPRVVSLLLAGLDLPDHRVFCWCVSPSSYGNFVTNVVFHDCSPCPLAIGWFAVLGFIPVPRPDLWLQPCVHGCARLLSVATHGCARLKFKMAHSCARLTSVSEKSSCKEMVDTIIGRGLNSSFLVQKKIECTVAHG